MCPMNRIGQMDTLRPVDPVSGEARRLDAATPEPGYWEQRGYDRDAYVGHSNGYGSA